MLSKKRGATGLQITLSSFSPLLGEAKCEATRIQRPPLSILNRENVADNTPGAALTRFCALA